MNTFITLKSLSDLSSDVVPIKEVSAPAIVESSQQPNDLTDEGVREEMHRRYTTPFVHTISYHHSGLNE